VTHQNRQSHGDLPDEDVVNSTRARPLLVAGALGMLTLGIGGCGSSHSSSRTTAASVTPAGTTQITATTATTAAPATAPTPAALLRILAPRPLAQLDQTVAVHVSVTGGVGTASRSFRYVLDGRLTRRGSARLTFTGVVPGHHHLLVALVSHPSVNATTAFTVLAPPAPAQAPSAPPMTSAAPQPAPAPTPSAPSAPMMSTGGIPQGSNAGDADGDNRGGPSDGDGNI
jgi:hypothetical protein